MMPPSPALKPHNGPYLPGQAFFSSSDDVLSDHVHEEKRKADMELRLISFSLQNEILLYRVRLQLIQPLH